MKKNQQKVQLIEVQVAQFGSEALKKKPDNNLMFSNLNKVMGRKM